MSKRQDLTIDEKAKLDLTKLTEINLENLTPEQKQEITAKLSETQLELVRKSQQAKIDLGATKQALDDFSDTVRTSTADGTSATITHTQTTSIGRTEVIMGNTERAAKGKISRSGAGLSDNSLKLVLVIAAAAVLVALFV